MQVFVKDRIGYAMPSDDCAKNTDIGIAVNGNVIDLQLASVRSAQGAVERVVVDAVATVEQRPVDVEQVGVEFQEIESVLEMFRRSRLGVMKSHSSGISHAA